MGNQIICGDCFDVLPTLPSNSVDLIIIDPPYLTTKESWDQKEVVNAELSEQLFRIAKDSCSLYVWCGIGEKSQSLIRWFPIFSELWHFKDLITWKKQRGIGMRKGWLYTREEIMWFVKDNKRFIWNKPQQYLQGVTRKRDGNGPIKESNKGYYCKSKFKRITNIWDDFTEQGRDVLRIKGHFTPKPLMAIERIIQLHTQENDIVLDCFLGSGTTALAAQNLNRRFVGIDISETYCKIAQDRVSEQI